eukprot:g5105.t1
MGACSWASNSQKSKLGLMNNKTEMCDLMDCIFDPQDALKYTGILTGEDYDTIGDLAFTFDKPPIIEQMDRELEEVGINGGTSRRIIDAVMYIYHEGGKNAAQTNLRHTPVTQRKGSACVRSLGRVRFELNKKVSVAKILGDTSIQARNGRVFSAVSEWIVSQLNENDDAVAESPVVDGEFVPVPPVPPPAAPDRPHGAVEE